MCREFPRARGRSGPRALCIAIPNGWGDESFADDLNMGRGIVSGRVALLLRSTEIRPPVPMICPLRIRTKLILVASWFPVKGAFLNAAPSHPHPIWAPEIGPSPGLLVPGACGDLLHSTSPSDPILVPKTGSSEDGEFRRQRAGKDWELRMAGGSQSRGLPKTGSCAGGSQSQGAPKDGQLQRTQSRNLQRPPSLKSLGNRPSPEGPAELAKSRRPVESGISPSPEGL